MNEMMIPRQVTRNADHTIKNTGDKSVSHVDQCDVKFHVPT